MAANRFSLVAREQRTAQQTVRVAIDAAERAELVGIRRRRRTPQQRERLEQLREREQIQARVKKREEMAAIIRDFGIAPAELRHYANALNTEFPKAIFGGDRGEGDRFRRLPIEEQAEILGKSRELYQQFRDDNSHSLGRQFEEFLIYHGNY